MESQHQQPPLTDDDRKRLDDLRERLAGLRHSSFKLPRTQSDHDALARARVRRVIRAIKPHVALMSAADMERLLEREGGSSPEEEKVSRALIEEVRAGGGFALFFKVPVGWAAQLGEKAGSYMMAGPIAGTRGDAYRAGIDALGRMLAVELPQLGGTASVPAPDLSRLVLEMNEGRGVKTEASGVRGSVVVEAGGFGDFEAFDGRRLVMRDDVIAQHVVDLAGKPRDLKPNEVVMPSGTVYAVTEHEAPDGEG